MVNIEPSSQTPTDIIGVKRFMDFASMLLLYCVAISRL